MKAVAYRKPLPIDHADSLIDIELPAPQARGRDLLVDCLLYTSPSPRDLSTSRMPSSA